MAATFAGPAHAHPVPKRFHDRLITVHLTPQAVRVEYHLEADAWTVVYVDLPAVNDQVDLTKLTQPKEFYESYTRVYAPILANNLSATLGGKPLPFRCTKYGWQDKDSIWCDYVFEAPWQPAAGSRETFRFREGNYELEAGQIKLSLVADPGVTLLEKTAPDEALKNRPATELRPGDDARLRQASAVFNVAAPTVAAKGEAGGSQPSAAAPTAEEGKEAQPTAPAGAPRQSSTLRNLLLDSRQGFILLLLAAAVFGAAHALTPGHGKTLVAAYLVGDRGTAWHAVLLGLVTTLTHTGAVIVLALLAGWFLPQVQVALALGAGLAVVALGLWKLFRSLTGRADHFHLPGTGHHHHHHGHDHDHAHHHHHDHDHADHYHDEHGHTHPLPGDSKRRIGSWGLILLGISGGIIPCVDAIAMFGLAVEMQRVWLAVPLLLAFSAGLAGVLIAIGLVVVWARGLAQARFGDSPRFRQVFRTLPIVSAVLITCLGLWICRGIIQAPQPAAAPAATSQP